MAKKGLAKPYSFLVIDATLPSDNALHFRKIFSEKLWKLINTIDHKIRYEKIQFDINREAAEILTLSSRKVDTY